MSGRAAERSLNGKGRVLVRYSGTEPLLRIMVEGPADEEVKALAIRRLMLVTDQGVVNAGLLERVWPPGRRTDRLRGVTSKRTSSSGSVLAVTRVAHPPFQGIAG